MSDVPGGVGRVGDDHERTADRAADLVVAGKSASHLFTPRGPAAAPTTAVQMQKDGNDGAQDSASVVAQMLPLFGKSPAKWARFIKGLHSIDAKKQLLQAIMNNPALGRPVGFGILKATIGTLSDVRDDFVEVMKWWGNSDDHRLAKGIYKKVLKPGYEAVVEPAVEVVEEKAKPFTDPIGTAQDIGRAVEAAYEKGGLQGVLAMPSVGVTPRSTSLPRRHGNWRRPSYLQDHPQPGHRCSRGRGHWQGTRRRHGRVAAGWRSQQTAKLATESAKPRPKPVDHRREDARCTGRKEPLTQPATKGAAPNTETTAEPSTAPTNKVPAEPAATAPDTPEAQSSTTAAGSTGQTPDGAQTGPGATGSPGSAAETTTVDPAPEAAKAGTSPEAQTPAKPARKPNKWMRKEERKNAPIDEFLRSRGEDPQPNPLEGKEGAGRRGDRLVGGNEVEYKTPDPGVTPKKIASRVSESVRGQGQARRLIFDVRGNSMTRAEALEALELGWKAARGKLDSLEIIGDDFYERK